jgi:DNA polymerase-3 subunit gamma/tau
MDVTEMDAASNNGVDNVRALRDEAVTCRKRQKKSVYCRRSHMLTGSAFNALLKILEEPPEH